MPAYYHGRAVPQAAFRAFRRANGAVDRRGLPRTVGRLVVSLLHQSVHLILPDEDLVGVGIEWLQVRCIETGLFSPVGPCLLPSIIEREREGHEVIAGVPSHENGMLVTWSCICVKYPFSAKCSLLL